MDWKAVAALSLGCLLFALAGCSNNGLVSVAGKVSVDGTPLEKGTINFYCLGTPGPTAGAAIRGGRYSVQVSTGRKKVEIFGYRIVGQKALIPDKPASPLVDVVEQTLPARYNTTSELTCNVASGGTDHDFALKSDGKTSAKK